MRLLFAIWSHLAHKTSPCVTAILKHPVAKNSYRISTILRRGTLHNYFSKSIGACSSGNRITLEPVGSVGWLVSVPFCSTASFGGEGAGVIPSGFSAAGKLDEGLV